MRKRRTFAWLLAMLLLAGCGGPSVSADSAADIPATKYIALTFDDGPKAGTTDVLLDGLRDRGASATFFVVGQQAQRYPELVRRMAAEGHQVGNHTWNHVRLEGADAATIEEEVGKTEQLLRELLGGEGYWLRPPYGQLTAGMESHVSVPMVKWSVDPRDWESRNADKVVEEVLRAAKPGSIILLHDIYPTSVEAALRVVDALAAEGYWFVTVEELLRLRGVNAEAGMLYRSA